MNFENIKNRLLGRYLNHPEAVVISCFFNPQRSPYRTKAFKIFYDSIKHLNHRIVECVIGDAKAELMADDNITHVYTRDLLWHKEALLNKIIFDLPKKYKYVFWVDADVIFTNPKWLVDGVEALQWANIIQPFEYCVHLEQDERKPSIDLDHYKAISDTDYPNRRVWRSFCANIVTGLARSENYNIHGHVGFAWGAKRSVLDQVHLYDKALIGGADHIIAHAAAGQIPHSCITKSFTDNIDEVNAWSEDFFGVTKGYISYVFGDLYHIWHGDIGKRRYLKRIQDFTPKTKHINKRDDNGLYVNNNPDNSQYINGYFREREVPPDDSDFVTSAAIGYMTDSTAMGGLIGGDFVGAAVGAAIGDMLNDKPEPTFSDGGGGSFSGGGSGGEFGSGLLDINDTADNFS